MEVEFNDQIVEWVASQLEVNEEVKNCLLSLKSKNERLEEKITEFDSRINKLAILIEALELS